MEGTITISFGVSNSLSKSLAHFPTVSSILKDPELKQFMGFGENVEARVNGVPGVEHLNPNDVVEIVSRANSKG